MKARSSRILRPAARPGLHPVCLAIANLPRREVIAGTLAYIAPEQTGRMNRSIDFRSYLYALGITFYEMLTGTLPLQGNGSDGLGALPYSEASRAAERTGEANS